MSDTESSSTTESWSTMTAARAQVGPSGLSRRVGGCATPPRAFRRLRRSCRRIRSEIEIGITGTGRVMAGSTVVSESVSFAARTRIAGGPVARLSEPGPASSSTGRCRWRSHRLRISGFADDQWSHGRPTPDSLVPSVVTSRCTRAVLGRSSTPCPRAVRRTLKSIMNERRTLRADVCRRSLAPAARPA